VVESVWDRVSSSRRLGSGWECSTHDRVASSLHFLRQERWPGTVPRAPGPRGHHGLARDRGHDRRRALAAPGRRGPEPSPLPGPDPGGRGLEVGGLGVPQGPPSWGPSPPDPARRPGPGAGLRCLAAGDQGQTHLQRRPRARAADPAHQEPSRAAGPGAVPRPGPARDVRPAYEGVRAAPHATARRNAREPSRHHHGPARRRGLRQDHAGQGPVPR